MLVIKDNMLFNMTESESASLCFFMVVHFLLFTHGNSKPNIVFKKLNLRLIDLLNYKETMIMLAHEVKSGND